jgi:hypothetical protein
MLPALLGRSRGAGNPLDRGPQVAQLQKAGGPPQGRTKPKGPPPNRRGPPEQPRVRYDHVMARNSEETRYKWAENQRAYFACPRDAFIAEISYRFDAVQSQLVKPFGWGAGGVVFTIRDKFMKNLSPEKPAAAFLRQPRSGEAQVPREAEAFRNLVNPPIAQSSLTETGCDPVLFCLGHQACLFKVTVDMCAADPVPGKRKMFFITVRCARDTTMHTYMWKRDEPILLREMDQVLYMVPDEKASNQHVAQVLLQTLPESEIFGIDCPRAHQALSNGYGGWCTLDPPAQIEIANFLWSTIGRVPGQSCRKELVEAYCAYHYNTSGGCIPPSFIDKPKNGRVLQPGEMPFSFRAVPITGSRPDMTTHEKGKKK